MMGRIGFIASATLLFQVILASEFDDSIYDLISNSLEGASPEFYPTEFDPLPVKETPAAPAVTRTPTIVRRRIVKNSDRVYFPSSRPLDYGYKPNVESIRVYECGNFFMRCEFRPNFDVEYPLHCKMVSEKF